MRRKEEIQRLLEIEVSTETLKRVGYITYFRGTHTKTIQLPDKNIQPEEIAVAAPTEFDGFHLLNRIEGNILVIQGGLLSEASVEDLTPPTTYLIDAVPIPAEEYLEKHPSDVIRAEDIKNGIYIPMRLRSGGIVMTTAGTVSFINTKSENDNDDSSY
jgi:hypothetical protein